MCSISLAGCAATDLVLRVAIDGIAVSHPQPGGYRTYATNLVKHLPLVDTANDYLLLVDRPIAASEDPNWRISVLPAVRGGVGVVWREQVAVPRYVARHHVDLLHSTCTTGPLRVPVPLVLTLYDDLEFSEPLPSPREARRWAMRVYSRFIQARLVHLAALVITISEYSKRQIVARFGLASERVAVTHLAPSASYRKIDCQVARAQSSRRHRVSNHVLAFVSAVPRKNTGRLMEAYACIDRTLRARHPLVLVCTHTGLRSKLLMHAEALGIRHHMVVVEQASDEDLLFLYNAAALFVFPSLGEGFGLPPLEAMACGTPVVSSNSSAMPEVLADAALLVSPTDVPTLADAMTAVLTIPSLAEELVEWGLARSRQFSWEATARQTLALYRSVVEGVS
jgi:glycosyltransferase involved in cell wall biosynthesis